MVHTMKVEVTKFSCFVDLTGTIFSTSITLKHVMLQWHSQCNCGWHVETFEPLSGVASMFRLEVSQFFVASESAEVTNCIHQVKEGPCMNFAYMRFTIPPQYFFYACCRRYLWVRHWIRFRGLWVWSLGRLFPGTLNLSLLLVIELWEYRCALHPLQDRACFNLYILFLFLWSHLSVRIKSIVCMLQPQK